MSGAAQREEAIEGFYGSAGTTESAAALKQMAAERLAAHRDRRAAVQAREAELRATVVLRREGARTESRRGASKVREAVAARYERSVSYREFLAAEAERALQQAQAEAEVAARKARAMADAQMELIRELEQWNQPEPGPREEMLAQRKTETRGDLARELADIALGARELMDEPVPLFGAETERARARAREFAAESRSVSDAVAEVSRAGLKVQLYEDLGGATRDADLRMEARRAGAGARITAADESPEELEQLEEEIAFRLAPGFEERVLETLPIPGNIIEFPRQLIASRKARPRLAEGPLREESAPEPQLRIFEVEAEQISVEPASVEPASAPEWQSLSLDAATIHATVAPLTAQTQFALPLQPAPLERRMMAAAVDACCIAAAMIGFVGVAVMVAGHGLLRGLALPRMGAAAGGTLLAIFVLYQMLFFTLAEATPGMLYARIGLCTFGDDNPTRQAMRRRVLATLLAACPVGIGLLWMWMDDDRLGWHDRMSRMYQRAY